MQKTTINGHNVEMYDDIEALPIRRYQKFSKLLLVEAGIGSTIADFDGHIERVARYMAGKDIESARQELLNLRQNVYMVQQGLSPQHLAFAVLVKTIDGKTYDDLSDESLQAVVDMFADASNADLAEATDKAKKKIEYSLSLYFPTLFQDATVKEYYDLVKKRTKLQLESIINGTDLEADVEKAENDIICFNKPKKYDGADGLEVISDKNFFDVCLQLQKEYGIDAKNLSTFEYYNAIEQLKEQVKRQGNGRQQQPY